MSYTEQAEKINLKIQNALYIMERGKNDIHYLSARNDLINAILWFGQVAKFRCRSNIAYDNFCREVFKDIVKIQRVPDENNLDWEKLQVV